MKKQLIIGTVMLSLLSGCILGPKYHRPAVKPPDAFRGAAASAPPTGPASLADLKWFEVFKDERLQELIRTALAGNYDLREAVARVDAARASLGVTRADQFPNIAAGGEMTTQRNARDGSFPFPSGISQERSFGSVALNETCQRRSMICQAPAALACYARYMFEPECRESPVERQSAGGFIFSGEVSI